MSTWVLSLMDDPVPGEVVSLADRRLGTVYRVIVRGTDVEITYRLLATGTPRLGMYGLTNPS